MSAISASNTGPRSNRGTSPDTIRICGVPVGDVGLFSSALIALALVLACFGIGYAVVVLANQLNRPWLMIPILLALAVGGFIFYIQVLNRLDAIALSHREALSEELCKA